ncbi:hypothetical protein GTW25_07830 [Aliihoeflea aestuarii]|uniref:hypothetical protein n=1 Tax=Aliihoeflea aestuarii TaxID=453840 RepID=UPI002093AF2F|nr:hypothetical protein [Aliihoeflea aestuarii]MCO6390935.1 hypothetical protein [Aliihoeflea aestuarii]
METSRTAHAGDSWWLAPIWRLPAFVLLLFAVLAYGGLPSVPSHPVAAMSAGVMDEAHVAPDQADESRNRIHAAGDQRGDVPDDRSGIQQSSAFMADVTAHSDGPDLQRPDLRYGLIVRYSSRAPPAASVTPQNPPPTHRFTV